MPDCQESSPDPFPLTPFLGPTRGAGGQYKLTVGDQTLTGKVRNGLMITEKTGRITLEPGRHELVLAPVRTTGSELFRPRHITLAPIRMP